ncbi:Protein Wnt-10b [Orchesella cincta]|uniref:Protein Wnt n=1 Tax=Orchesella cincta TaxID=48709 RepID=A0A1D2MHL1_ORCCI|nr:Protein Wnt-10b [Orchesella cincta]
MELCIRAPETTKVAIQGIHLAADECAFQMAKHRWNCSSLQGSTNPHGTQLFKKGYRESAFGHAIAAAGIAYSVAKACSQGKLLSCGCGFQYDDQVNYIPSKEADYAFDESNEAIFKKGSNSISSWKWSGCSHNMDYGMKFAKLFLDSREKSHDLPALTNLHNNKVGRVAVSANMEVRCKCHGLSGSCELRTCWRSPPEFRRVGLFLKNKFRKAIMIDQSELGNRPLSRVQKLNKQRRKRRDRQSEKRSNANIDLWYYERSPTYCESNKDFSIPGTTGRRCNKTATRGEMGSCSTLCCGRGYNTIRQVYTTRCNCQFIWCCQVTCRNCTVDEWITVCK